MASETATSSVPYLPQTATVFRIRRKRTADPHDAIIVSLKRSRHDGSLPADIFAPLLFQLATTSENPDVSSIRCLKLSPNTSLNVIDYEPSMSESDEHTNQRVETSHTGSEGDSPLVARSGGTGVVDGAGFGVDQRRKRHSTERITVDGAVCTSLGRAEQPGYVFDFYWNARGIQHPIDQLEIRLVNREEVEFYTGEETESSSDTNDEDDSNSQNSWRNDCPDEESQDDTYDDSEEEYCNEGNLELRFCEFRCSDSESDSY